MSHPAAPDISAILVTPDDYATIRNTIECLGRQTARDRMEAVIVAPSARNLGMNEADLDGFWGFRIVEVGAIRTKGAAYAAGVRQARAEIVALTEDHSFPDPDWAGALMEAHDQGWAAVGPVMCNGNPGSAISEADFLIAYGPWMEGVAAGEAQHLPGHNSSYKRGILLEYGPALESMFESESVMQWDLRGKGHRLRLEPRAKTFHLNFARLSPWTSAQFHSGRVFAAARARGWSTTRRLVYTCAAPLIPGIRLARIMRYMRLRSCKKPVKVPAAVAYGLIVSALGEMAGYAAGPGNSPKILMPLEFHRVRHLGR